MWARRMRLSKRARNDGEMRFFNKRTRIPVNRKAMGKLR